MFHRKSIEQLLFEANQTGEGTLKRTLTSFNLISLGVGAIIGAGLFSLTGIAAAETPDPPLPFLLRWQLLPVLSPVCVMPNLLP